eukprot:CAMPEP_0119304986 /NCGR_PEP_ID=MMETSP1333-20130426/6082_1 /TAXON_ID=418940 /ORGANISM="Scyphosphaera apsteinii, Strain RCC1455" /LENGTH=500 /DNA_ID=CAMNT_0007307977 /DNA_START=62 /DNA_END=1564 /DNA_ORIENTATION=-
MINLLQSIRSTLDSIKRQQDDLTQRIFTLEATQGKNTADSDASTASATEVEEDAELSRCSSPRHDPTARSPLADCPLNSAAAQGVVNLTYSTQTLPRPLEASVPAVLPSASTLSDATVHAAGSSTSQATRGMYRSRRTRLLTQVRKMPEWSAAAAAQAAAVDEVAEEAATAGADTAAAEETAAAKATTAEAAAVEAQHEAQEHVVEIECMAEAVAEAAKAPLVTAATLASSADSSPVFGHPEGGLSPSSGGDELADEEGVEEGVVRGGGFLPLTVKGDTMKQLLCADSLAPTQYLTPDACGMVSYRHDTLLLRSLWPMGNCLLEGLMTATGMGVGDLGVNRKQLDKYMDEWHIHPKGGPSFGVLDKVLQKAKSPFRLPTIKKLNANLKWTLLLNLTEGVYLVLVLALDDNKYIGHFVVFDAWRDLLIMGPKWGALRVHPEDKKSDEESVHSYLLKHYQLVSPVRVCRLDVAANRVSETKFNTPAHYAVLEEKRAKKMRIA